MAVDFEIKQDDTLPSMSATLQKTVSGSLTPINLTAATRVDLMLKETNAQGAPVTVKKQAVVIDATNGVVRVDWIAGNTAAAGIFNAEFQITSAAGIQTVPNDGYFQVEFLADLGD